MRAIPIVRGARHAAAKLELAKRMRREPTAAEDKLWQRLRGNRIGAHFRRQQVFDGYILDFFCFAVKLVVEVDGGVHNDLDQIESDGIRSDALEQQGLQVIRFGNHDIEDNIERVLDAIRECAAVDEPAPPSLRSAP